MSNGYYVYVLIDPRNNQVICIDKANLVRSITGVHLMCKIYQYYE